ncbi:hypothetical protein E3E36_01745 [Thermococcus sp. M36]|uniref:hypothetical protein n=1 Tax=Thermococcus sp. M36 TaxID=1638261 RepID=UPI00143A689C|nr:hypothetical protein [Thermococcus sp. M36]NJE04892.1 hypothetical protein [Thermococcus sp. M36]
MDDVETARLLIRIGGIVGIIEPLVIGLLLLITIIGIVIAVPLLILAWWIYKRSSEAVDLAEMGRYREARDKVIVPAVVALILTSRVGGILMLIGAVLLPSEKESAGGVGVY